MLFEVDSKTKKTSVTIQKDDTTEKYQCTFLACDNPMCTCGNLYINFFHDQNDSKSNENKSIPQINVDVQEKKVIINPEKQKSKDELELEEYFFNALENDDYQFLYKEFFSYKNLISEKAPIDSIDAHFDYLKVETEGLMYAYNDVLPYGDQIIVSIDGQNYFVLDQYCLLPKCPCTDTSLTILPVETSAAKTKPLCLLSLRYATKKWEPLKGQGSVFSFEKVRETMVNQVPDLYGLLRKRHLKLKAVYAHCKKKNSPFGTPVETIKVGRNDPCPCGSGRKYKKCCG